MDNDLSHMRITIWVTFATLALVILFATFPSIDLSFSALFFSPVEQPWSGREPFPEWLRDTLREGTELATLLAFMILVGNLRLGTLQRTGWRVWAFLCGPVILCAGLLVNGVLKATIGRARPFSVTEFGGQQLFTPPFQYSAQCYSNCSFSSGETALIASFFLPLCVLVWPRLQRRGRLAMGSIAAGMIVLMSGLRIAAGGHFLSDVVMSILFSALTTLFLYRLLAVNRHRHLFTVNAVRADTVSIWRNGRHAVLTRLRRWWPKIKAAASRLQRPPDAGAASS
ncbi:MULTISPECIES: phosphatase PAP2 family protein [Agrobacterium]|uniref:Phosphatase PAP2 family protein n=1 Tax=Agrobacterium salinitolerans TaxID=1183413 RepID=A0A4Z1R7X9_9HYPH|nr:MULTISPECIES: phosphatase PAP2 family protein [Agrobacterium]MCZ7856873.1 phosphatase PAP2 family protein [Agrobacterium salinitolerans]MCZ7886118.1 phosphatase PAP2 family protein [Agrobacterium salinitolerans]MCZ7890209.1 phosphatase PAP2 family protein [Agrobacterium salinitolerans]MCZ7938696.1 phosphatase PAP2 family protein [Agrobacterium salinitolerans]MDA5628081.1 phosphatase PAP2 family protein [Agrobacterium sp. ST15.16.055]